jgi:PhzF family phenazine biosynthesis protein
VSQSVVVVDAFTEKPFAGNPAAVCVLTEEKPESWMQQTAFLMGRPDGWALRWFTPTVEVALCGHATLASAHVMWETGILSPEETARFRTKSGILTAARRGDWIELDFPARPAKPGDAHPDLAEALGVRPVRVGTSAYDLLAELDSEAAVRDLKPNLSMLERIPVRGVIVTAPATTPGFDFVSRFFAPQSGVPEDPVTGSAHCSLGPWWQERLGKADLLAYQASPRGGIVRVGVRGDRVRLGGQAVTTLRGTIDA